MTRRTWKPHILDLQPIFLQRINKHLTLGRFASPIETFEDNQFSSRHYSTLQLNFRTGRLCLDVEARSGRLKIG